MLFFSVWGKAQLSTGNVVYSEDKDLAIFEHYLEVMEPKRTLPTGELMVETARFFLGTPYVASTLENIPEGLVVNFRGLDCMTLVENTIALVRTLKMEKPSFQRFTHFLRSFRYRDEGLSRDTFRLVYTDRLHYTSDWIYENQKMGRVKDMTSEMGGKPLKLDLNFMSTHPDSYKQLKDNPEQIARIAGLEKTISSRSYFYIPEDEINKHADLIQVGDIVCFVTTVKGLDISHVGIIYREGDKLTFIHASTSQKKVILNPEPLQEYVQGIKRNCGIMIVRPQF